MAAAKPAMKTGGAAPGFSCPSLPTKGGKSRKITLSGLLAKGNVVVLSFFHTTCKPCITEIPKLTKIVDAQRAAGVVAYLVFVGEEDDDTLRKFMRKNRFKLPVLVDRYGLRVGERYGVVRNDIAYVPQIMVISKNGVLKHAWRGFSAATERKLPGILAKLAGEKKASRARNTMTVLFTNNTNGMIGPAPGTGLGGLARRATVVRRERRKSTSCILLDAGDFLPTSPNKVRSRKIIAAYELLRYDAIGIGETEFVNGLKYLRSMVKNKKLPFISSNVKLCKDDVCSDLVPSRKVVKVGKRKVAIFSYMHKSTVGFAPKERFKDGEWYVKWVDYIPQLKGFLSVYRRKVDVIVVLSHAGIDEDRRLAQEIEGIDVIVGGHSQTLVRRPETINGTVIVQAASDGQYVGKLVLKFLPSGRPVLKSYSLVGLTKSIAENRIVKAAVSGGK